MAFHFRFNAFLRHRRFLLKEAQSALADARFQRMQIRERIRRTQEHMGEQWRMWEEKQKTGMDADYFITFRDYLDSLERQLQLMEKELEQASVEVAKKKETVTERDKAVKMLENLEEKDKQAYRYFETWEEQKQLDEVAVFKDFRDRNTSGND